jgi:hypothetical protein
LKSHIHRGVVPRGSGLKSLFVYLSICLLSYFLKS